MLIFTCNCIKNSPLNFSTAKCNKTLGQRPGKFPYHVMYFHTAQNSRLAACSAHSVGPMLADSECWGLVAVILNVAGCSLLAVQRYIGLGLGGRQVEACSYEKQKWAGVSWCE